MIFKLRFESGIPAGSRKKLPKFSIYNYPEIDKIWYDFNPIIKIKNYI